MNDVFGTVDLHRRVARGELTPEQAAWILMQRDGRWGTWQNGLIVGMLCGVLLTILALRIVEAVAS